MQPQEAKKIIRQRTRPWIVDFCFVTTHAHLRAFKRFRRLLQDEQRPLTFIDIGCGQKPFQNLLTDVDVKQYTGVDFDTNRSKADVVAPADALPFEENSFDAIIASEVYEHTPNLDKAIAELRRVAKNGALAYISTPFMFPEHGTPYDFQRITQYRYRELFKHDEILYLRGTNVSLATPFFLFNVNWENITVVRMIPGLTHLVYVWNNLWALLMQAVAWKVRMLGRIFFRSRKDWFQKLYDIYFSALPGGYDVIVRIRK